MPRLGLDVKKNGVIPPKQSAATLSWGEEPSPTAVHVTNPICMMMERTLGFQHSCLPTFSHS